MANTIQVTTSTLTSKANELKSLNARFKQQVTSLQSQQRSLDAMWDGEANTAFNNAFKRDIVQMNNFYNAIEKYVSSLNEIINKYEQTERANAQKASNRSYK